MGQETIFYCCECSFGPHLTVLYSACIVCHHCRCRGCSEEVVKGENGHTDFVELSKSSTGHLKDSKSSVATYIRDLEIRHQRVLTTPDVSQTDLLTLKSSPSQFERDCSDSEMSSQKFTPSTPTEDAGQDTCFNKMPESTNTFPSTNTPSTGDSSLDLVLGSLSTPITDVDSSIITISDVEDNAREEYPSSSPLQRLRKMLLDYLMQSFCTWLYRNLRQKPNGNTSKTSANTGTSSRSSDSPTGKESTSSNNSQKREHQSSGNASDNSRSDGERRKKRRQKSKDKSVENSHGLKFACPYYKRQPYIYQTSRGCAGPGWDEVHRVK
jgi:hypothetical protein